MKEKLRTKRLKQWKTRMKGGIKQVEKWLKGSSGVYPAVASKGTIADTPKKAAEKIKEFWEDTFKGEGAEERETKRQGAKEVLKDSFDKRRMGSADHMEDSNSGEL